LKTIDQVIGTVSRPERILQYGEGNFLRAFVDWQIDILNERTGFNGNVVVVQPRNREGAQGALINAQRGLYTVVLRGMAGGGRTEEYRTIRSVSRCVNPYTQFDAYLACAENPELRVVVSNTTEAGIEYRGGEGPEDRPQLSFPGKVTAFLYRRYTCFRGDPAKALVFLPCELIDRNGDALRAVVERHAAEWGLGEGFARWLGACVFCNTLVDRIVSGFPGGEAEALWKKLGYRDDLLTAGEPFYLWVIETPAPGVPPWEYRRELPLEEAGLRVIWTDNLEGYRTRKLRILNGAHSATALAAYLYGLDTVEQCVSDPAVYRFMRQAIFDEIIPSIEEPAGAGAREAAGTGVHVMAGPDDGADDDAGGGLFRFAQETLERFSNPFIKHQLLSISLNGVSKFKTRIVPSMLAYQKLYSRAPGALCCSLAALCVFYRGRGIAGGEMEGRRIKGGWELPYPIRDDERALRYFVDFWAALDAARGCPAAAAAGDVNRGAGTAAGMNADTGTNVDVNAVVPAGLSAALPAAPDSPVLQELVHGLLSRRDLWGEDLGRYPALEVAVAEALGTILRDGMGAALARAAGPAVGGSACAPGPAAGAEWLAAVEKPDAAVGLAAAENPAVEKPVSVSAPVPGSGLAADPAPDPGFAAGSGNEALP
jgi:mannitol-1-phosphate/altronate dehydrogenase